MFGEATTPSIAEGRVPLVLELLSPAHRPLQITRDLGAFWAGSYREVQKEMKGRYPKHVWPDDPANTAPTRRTKNIRNGESGLMPHPGPPHREREKQTLRDFFFH